MAALLALTASLLARQQDAAPVHDRMYNGPEEAKARQRDGKPWHKAQHKDQHRQTRANAARDRPEIWIGRDAIDAFAIVPLIAISAVIPITFAGWGVREGVVVVVLTAIGFQPEVALLLSVSFGTALLIASLPGALIYFSLLGRKPTRVRGRPSVSRNRWLKAQRGRFRTLWQPAAYARRMAREGTLLPHGGHGVSSLLDPARPTSAGIGVRGRGIHWLR